MRARKDESSVSPPDDPGSVGWVEAQTLCLVPEGSSFSLEMGGSIGPVTVEYETYGKLAPNKDNVVFVAHALSGDAHVAGWDRKAAETGRAWRQKKPGWWDAIVGPGKALDTNKYFVICP